MRPKTQACERGLLRVTLIDVDLLNKYGRDRAVIYTHSRVNIITQAGLAQLAVGGTSAPSAYITHMAIGDDDTVPATTDSALGNELVSKVFDSVDDGNLTGDDPYLVYTTTYNTTEPSPTGAGDITEAGLKRSDGVLMTHLLIGRGDVEDVLVASPATGTIISSTAHGLETGQAHRLYFTGVGGTTELNTGFFWANYVDDDSFELFDDEALATPTDSSGWGAFSGGGVWTVSIPKTSSNVLEADYELHVGNAS